MKRSLLTLIILIASCLTLTMGSAFAQRQPESLTNSAVVKLVRAGFKEKTVVAIIHSRPNNFDLNPDRLIELKHNGVTENIILAMLSQGGRDFASDDLGDDAFFRNPSNSRSAAGDDGQKEQGTSIFGSGGSSQSQSHGRGMSGSNEGNTLTTGSATVRILRPPVEEGGGTAKLEKTPTLTNESVIQLVEAGFSEGTIVKRIEKSPAEFDLSPAKVTELRKHRVTEPIILAMSAAMGETPGPGSAPPKNSREN